MYIKIKVTADAKKELFKKINDTEFHIAVKKKAKQNQANKRIIELVREKLKITKGDIRIVSGHHSPSKVISIDLK